MLAKIGGQVGARHPVRGQVDASKQAAKSVPGTRSAAHRLAADGYGKRDKGRPKSVLGTRCSANLSKAASQVVYGISGRCSAARPPARLYLLSASGDLGIPDWELRATRKPRKSPRIDGPSPLWGRSDR